MAYKITFLLKGTVNALVLISLLIVGSAYSSEKINQQLLYSDCGLNKESRRLARLIIEDPIQNRIELKCNAILSKIASKKAKEMARLGRVTHVGLRPANRRLIDEGYELASIYPTLFENNVEAIAGGILHPEKMWETFKKSKAHRVHLLAEHDFYKQQDEIGVGYFEDKRTPHIQYWVVYIANRNKEKRYVGEIAKSKD